MLNKIRFALIIVVTLIGTNIQAQSNCWCQNNLVVNGDFEQGNTGFNSVLQYWPPGIACMSLSYRIETSSNVCWPGTNVQDIINTGGNIMIIDNQPNGRNANIEQAWQQLITVQTNQCYQFSMDYYPEVSNNTPLPTLQIQINGSVVFSYNPTANGWQNVNFTWNSLGATSADLEVLHTAPGRSQGNSAIDNICFKSCGCCSNDLGFFSTTTVPSSYYFPGDATYPEFTYSIEDFQVQVPSSTPITKLRATVTSFEWIADEDCKKCVKSPLVMGSILGIGSVGQLQLQNPPTNVNPNVLSSEIEWANPSGADLVAGDVIRLMYVLPSISSLECCKGSAKVCIRFTYEDENCGTCEVFTCSTIELKANNAKRADAKTLNLLPWANKQTNKNKLKLR